MADVSHTPFTTPNNSPVELPDSAGMLDYQSINKPPEYASHPPISNNFDSGTQFNSRHLFQRDAIHRFPGAGELDPDPARHSPVGVSPRTEIHEALKEMLVRD